MMTEIFTAGNLLLKPLVFFVTTIIYPGVICIKPLKIFT